MKVSVFLCDKHKRELRVTKHENLRRFREGESPFLFCAEEGCPRKPEWLVYVLARRRGE